MNTRIVVFQGDSITDCGRNRSTAEPNVGLGSGYPSLVAARLLGDHPLDDYRCYNRGNSGDRVVDLYARWKADTLFLRPDVLSILIGVNDTWHEYMEHPNGVEVQRYKMIYEMLLEWTRKVLPETQLVLCEPFGFHNTIGDAKWADEMRQRAEIVRELARKFDAHFVPMAKVLDEAKARGVAPEKLSGDGVHPALTGHQLLADAWLKATQDLF